MAQVAVFPNGVLSNDGTKPTEKRSGKLQKTTIAHSNMYSICKQTEYRENTHAQNAVNL